jgi:hypothetical protein
VTLASTLKIAPGIDRLDKIRIEFMKFEGSREDRVWMVSQLNMNEHKDLSEDKS